MLDTTNATGFVLSTPFVLDAPVQRKQRNVAGWTLESECRFQQQYHLTASTASATEPVITRAYLDHTELYGGMRFTLALP